MKIIFLLLSVLPALAQAGVEFQITITEHHPKVPNPRPSILLVDIQNSAVRYSVASDQNFNLIKNQKRYIFDSRSKTYQVRDLVTVDQAIGEMQATLSRVESLPSSQIQAFEGTLAHQRQELAEYRQPFEYHATARYETINNLRCKIWEETKANIKRAELCVVAQDLLPEGVEMGRGLTVMGEFLEFVGRLTDAASIFRIYAKIPTLGGIPMFVRCFVNGSVVSESEISPPRKHAFSQEMFKVPTDYKQVPVGTIQQ